jgi:hypothetical protein
LDVLKVRGNAPCYKTAYMPFYVGDSAIERGGCI